MPSSLRLDDLAELVKRTVYKELERQDKENQSPYVYIRGAHLSSLLVDGKVNMNQLAEAILSALPAPIRERAERGFFDRETTRYGGWVPWLDSDGQVICWTDPDGRTFKCDKHGWIDPNEHLPPLTDRAEFSGIITLLVSCDEGVESASGNFTHKGWISGLECLPLQESETVVGWQPSPVDTT